MSKVNLDALIPKADFIASGTAPSGRSRISERLHFFQLLKGADLTLYHLLKKPDFQRETNEWDKRRIADLIESFIERAFIPSIILWENEESGFIYVIDGAHRLSAILAYINSDYGNGPISHEFNRYTGIPEEEKELAEEVEDYVNGRFGSYADLMKGGGRKYDDLKTGYFDVQMIKGDVKKAEESFFKINAQGVILSPTEKELCKNRQLPSRLATRCVMKGASGHQYWGGFQASNQTMVKDVSEEINTILFHPPYNEQMKSTILHQPLGGSITNAMPMVYELMKIVKLKYKDSKVEATDITNGGETFDYLQLTRKLLWQTLSEKAGSLGLYPSVYFYSNTNKFIHGAFLGMMQLLIENDGKKDDDILPTLTKVRGNLEQFIIKYKMFLGQINSKFGSKERSHRHFKGFFMFLIQTFEAEYPKSFDQCEKSVLLKSKELYPNLNELDSDVTPSKNKRFSNDTKIWLTTKAELDGTERCGICGGLIHPLSRDYDHKQDRKHGGGSEAANAQATHFYCNNSKDMLIELGIYKP